MSLPKELQGLTVGTILYTTLSGSAIAEPGIFDIDWGNIFSQEKAAETQKDTPSLLDKALNKIDKITKPATKKESAEPPSIAEPKPPLTDWSAVWGDKVPTHDKSDVHPVFNITRLGAYAGAGANSIENGNSGLGFDVQTSLSSDNRTTCGAEFSTTSGVRHMQTSCAFFPIHEETMNKRAFSAGVSANIYNNGEGGVTTAAGIELIYKPSSYYQSDDITYSASVLSHPTNLFNSNGLSDIYAGGKVSAEKTWSDLFDKSSMKGLVRGIIQQKDGETSVSAEVGVRFR